MCFAVVAGAQTSTTAPSTTAVDSNPATATSSTPAPIAPPAAPVWSVGSVDFSGYLDGYFSYNANRPASQTSGYYNFDELNQFNLEAAKLTINHDPDPVGIHADILFGRTNTDLQSNGLGINNIEQAYISVKPTKAKGFELDFGQFVTSAGQEVIETMNNWSYSHGLLFTEAIPYYHFGLRTSMPVTKSWTAGVQVVNGWNNVTDNNGGVTIGLTSSLVKPKYTWNTNYYVGPENSGFPLAPAGTQKGYRNLFDTTLLLTPTAKFNMYVNYDYTQNHTPAFPGCGECEFSASRAASRHLQGIAASARGQVTAKAALVGRFEYLADQGPTSAGIVAIGTGTKQKLKEFTATYEYKWLAGLLVRAEYRYDWSNVKVFEYGNDSSNFGPSKTSQQTLTVGMIAFFGPKR